MLKSQLFVSIIEAQKSQRLLVYVSLEEILLSVIKIFLLGRSITANCNFMANFPILEESEFRPLVKMTPGDSGDDARGTV